jgi:hypothetical protein
VRLFEDPIADVTDTLLPTVTSTLPRSTQMLKQYTRAREETDVRQLTYL